MLNRFRKGSIARAQIDLILTSGLFFEDHYRAQLDERTWSTEELAQHFIYNGEKQGCSANPLFDKNWYLAQYPDVAASDQSPFAHFVQYGQMEGRSPHPLLSLTYYASQSATGMDRPFQHFIETKGRSGFSPHPILDVAVLLKLSVEAGETQKNLLLWFMEDADLEQYITANFDGAYYAQQLGQSYSWPRHSVLEFLRRSKAEQVSPHLSFDMDYYLKSNDDARASGTNGYLHFLFEGRKRGSSPGPHAVGGGGLPLRGRKLDGPFDGNYNVETVVARSGGPRPWVAPTTPLVAEGRSIALRYAAAQRDLKDRFRLDALAPGRELAPGAPVISILMPVYRPPIVYLDRAIRSVLQQSYSNWELCIVDDCSGDKDIQRLIKGYAAYDGRIKVAIAKNNGGISRASNAALNMSTGSYISLFDHDDLLTFDAIEMVTKCILENLDVDFIYSDECRIDEVDSPVDLFSKPDWSPTFLLSCMYTGHFTTYRKSFVSKLGGFRSDFDFSQDYDLALRMSELQPRVAHVKAYIYGWRMIPGSAAQGGKPEARLTNVAALQDAVERRSYPGVALGVSASNCVAGSFVVSRPKVSIVIPSDNYDNISVSIKSIEVKTTYKNFEILVVTNSKIIEKLNLTGVSERVLLVPYDKVFNFSDKCNVGAGAATGDYIVFYNDDVRILSPDWIELLLSYAILDSVGAVAPKLLYEDGSIQHAGMVTGVRRLVGTAFHTRQAETSEHFGMAQYPREVSLLCGACIMVRAGLYAEIGGFDAVNAPINHSDVDLCFRIREAGQACVYVPTASLEHIGHLSIGGLEKKETKTSVKRDKVDIFLLKRWPQQVSYDPYFPPPMRDILYHDSQEKFAVYPRVNISPIQQYKADVLLVSHDLTNSGAPKIVLDLVRVLRAGGYYVCVLSPTDGPMRRRLNEVGADVIVDEVVFEQNPNVADLVKNFDFAIANTVVSWPLVEQMGGTLPIYWYIHESELIDHYASHAPGFIQCFSSAAGIWAGSGKSAGRLARHGIENVKIIPYGIDEPTPATRSELGDTGRPTLVKMSIGVFGSFEPRKGQDLAVLAVLNLPEEIRRNVELRLFGRTLDHAFFEAVRALAGDEPSIVINGELSPQAYEYELAQVDIVLCPSRDDTLPLVSLDALCQSKVLVVSRSTGTSEWVEHGVAGFVLEYNSPQESADILEEIFASRDQWSKIGAAARTCFEQNFSWPGFSERILALVAHSQTAGTDEPAGLPQTVSG